MFIGLLEVSGRQIVSFQQKLEKKAFTPGTGMTLFIALLLSMAAIILLQQTNIIHFAFPNIIVQMGSWVCMVVFFFKSNR